MKYIDILNNRRSVYDLNDTLPISEEELKKLIEEVTVASPTSFNMQSSQVVVLMNNAHHQLWDIVTDTLKEIVPEEAFKSTQKKMKMFDQAKGTILFFEDQDIVEQMKTDFPLYKDQFDSFAYHSMGILQGNIWNALAEVNIGASLQHYNPLIDERVRKQFDLPANWQLTAQMVFGGIHSIPDPKEKIPAEKRVTLIY